MLLWEIRDALEEEGFKTTWKDPFFEYLHSSQPKGIKDEPPEGEILYIPDLPIPKIAPYDHSSIAIRVITDQIYFQLSFYYYKALEEAIEAETIHDIYDQHASLWFPATANYFHDIASKFSLQWDTECDAYIEDSLYGFFPIKSIGQVISVVRTIRKEYLDGNLLREEVKG